MSRTGLKAFERLTNNFEDLRLTSTGFDGHLSDGHDVAIFYFAIKEALREKVSKLVSVGRSFTSGVLGLFGGAGTKKRYCSSDLDRLNERGGYRYFRRRSFPCHMLLNPEWPTVTVGMIVEADGMALYGLPTIMHHFSPKRS